MQKISIGYLKVCKKFKLAVTNMDFFFFDEPVTTMDKSWEWSQIYLRDLFLIWLFYSFSFLFYSNLKKKKPKLRFWKNKFEINHHILGNSEKWILISQIFYRDNNKK